MTKTADAKRLAAFINKTFGPDTSQHYPRGCPTSPRKTSFKSNFAFRRTTENYLEKARFHAEQKGGKFVVRLWTLTAAAALSYSEYMGRWNRFLTAAKRRYPGFSCIRVIEVHPGEDYEVPGEPGHWETISHGLHIHFVADRYYSQRELQKIAHRCGLGHISVTGRCTATKEDHTIQSAVNYLSKYLRKQLFENCRGLRGRRVWAPVNFPEAVGVRDVLFTSRWGVVYERLSVDLNFCNHTFAFRALIADHGEMVSRMLGKGMHRALQEIESASQWPFSVRKLVAILKPSEPGSPYFQQDREGYGELPAPMTGSWPGVEKYLAWLQSPDGLQWAQQQRQARNERDRERQRERRRELANPSD